MVALWWPAAVRPAEAQGTLTEAVARAREAWLAHDAAGLASLVDTVVLRLPGIDDAATAGPGQASRLLGQYLQPSSERGLELKSVQETGADRGYAQVERRYVVRGTSDEIRETVFLAFRKTRGRWRMSEIRVTP